MPCVLSAAAWNGHAASRDRRGQATSTTASRRTGCEEQRQAARTGTQRHEEHQRHDQPPPQVRTLSASGSRRQLRPRSRRAAAPPRRRACVSTASISWQPTPVTAPSRCFLGREVHRRRDAAHRAEFLLHPGRARRAFMPRIESSTSRSSGADTAPGTAADAIQPCLPAGRPGQCPRSGNPPARSWLTGTRRDTAARPLPTRRECAGNILAQ